MVIYRIHDDPVFGAFPDERNGAPWNTLAGICVVAAIAVSVSAIYP